MSTRIRALIQTEGYCYHGVALKQFLSKQYKMHNPFGHAPTWTNKKIFEYLSTLKIPGAKILVLKEPRKSRVQRSQYKRILQARGLGRPARRSNAILERPLFVGARGQRQEPRGIPIPNLPRDVVVPPQAEPAQPRWNIPVWDDPLVFGR